jgi:DNA-binding CsgD family transcriptional regulator
MQSLAALVESIHVLGQPERIVDFVLDDLANVAPRVHFGVALFGSERALTMSLSRARVGRTAADFDNHAHLYARSGVRWNRWSVTPADRKVVSIERMPREALGHFWSTHGIHEHRRIIACDGPRAIAWIGASVVDDRALDAETWQQLAQRMVQGAALLRSSHRVAGRGPDSTADVADHEIVAYFAPDGTVLAQKNAEYTFFVKAASARLAANLWTVWRFEKDGRGFELAPAAALQDHGGFVLKRMRGEVDRYAAREFLEALRRGLTNREIAVMLGTTPTAVKKRLERLYARHEASNRVELLHVLDERARHSS